MQKIYVVSGPCGCGKTTFTDAFAKHLIETGQNRQIYAIHGDDFHKGFVDTSDSAVTPDCEALTSKTYLYWPDILAFNWECILNVAESALSRGMDVVIDYIVEDELPQLIRLANTHHAKLFYTVLTASNEMLTKRLQRRGSEELIERSLFLKEQLERAPENEGHLLHNEIGSVAQLIRNMNINDYEISL